MSAARKASGKRGAKTKGSSSAIYAESLTHDAIMDSLRHRRTFGVRGGEPLVVDFRINGRFMGQFVSPEGQRRSCQLAGSRAKMPVNQARA